MVYGRSEIATPGRGKIVPRNIMQYNTSNNRTPGSRFYSDLLDTSVCIHQVVLKRLSKC